MTFFRPLILSLVALSASPARAGEADDALVTTPPVEHRIEIGGKPVDYVARWSELALKDEKGAAQATISATSYVVPSRAGAERPVMFVFNGGPGASSSPLHFNTMGPRIRSDGDAMVDNGSSPLDLMDLVFVDPVGTGFSAVLPGGSGAAYWSVDGDAQAVSRLIHAWLRDNDRTGAPVLIAGESYGGTRLVALLPAVSDLRLAGLLLVSPSLDMPAEESDLGAILTMPSLAVAAAENGKVPAEGRTAASIFEEARAFALGPYASALLQGGAIPAAERKSVAAALAARIAMPADELERRNLRIDVESFRSTLRADEGLVVGRLDSRVTAPKPAEVAGRPSAANDPALGLGKSNVIRSRAIDRYFRDELGIPNREGYVSLTLDVNFQWRWTSSEQPGVATGRMANLTSAMAAHPRLQTYVVGGYYDLAVPVSTIRYAIDHAWLPVERVRVATFATGHSVFEGEAGRRAMKSLLVDLAGAIKGKQ